MFLSNSLQTHVGVLGVFMTSDFTVRNHGIASLTGKMVQSLLDGDCYTIKIGNCVIDTIRCYLKVEGVHHSDAESNELIYGSPFIDYEVSDPWGQGRLVLRCLKSFVGSFEVGNYVDVVLRLTTSRHRLLVDHVIGFERSMSKYCFEFAITCMHSYKCIYNDIDSNDRLKFFTEIFCIEGPVTDWKGLVERLETLTDN
jgi:hypothetical protein